MNKLNSIKIAGVFLGETHNPEKTATFDDGKPTLIKEHYIISLAFSQDGKQEVLNIKSPSPSGFELYKSVHVEVNLFSKTNLFFSLTNLKAK